MTNVRQTSSVWQSVHRLQRALARVTKTRYPGFIFGKPLAPGEVPVFVYHDVNAEEFAADLAFLRDNGYRTLTTEEFVRGVYRDQRAVLLTFDDARSNFWQVAFPLLERYEAKATLFVPTYWVGTQNSPKIDQKDGLSQPKVCFMSWDELRVCANSGYVDVQAHGHRHALVYTSAQLAGFAIPQALAQYDLFDWPMRCERPGNALGYPPLGTPVYRAMPLFSARTRMRESQVAVQACRALVERNGGAAFFRRPAWREELLAAHEQALQQAPVDWVSSHDFRALVASEFNHVQRLFVAELGRKARYWAYPWMLGTAHSLRLAAEYDFEAAFGVGMDHGRIRRITSEIPVFSRIKADWLRFLPGKNRANISQTLMKKCREWMTQQHFAH